MTHNGDIRWRKNLYENRDLPDNYTDSTFLEELEKNIKPNNVTTIEAIALGSSISIQLSIVILFVMVFIWLNNEWTTPNITFTSSAGLTVFGYLCHTLKLPDMPDKISKDIRTALIFLAFGYILSPVLKTLTETVSTDTIYAMTIFMFLIHLIFSKYGSPQVSLSDSLSITSSIFGSLMLASRLASPLHAFSLLTVAVQCFVLLPFLLSKIENKVVISILLTASTVYLLGIISPTLTCVFVAVTIFVHVICPLWYIRWQKYKDNIYGPWDEAVIK
ncbi:phosphatidylinositol N-acetylglucosaminyltransferase subunit C [Diachasma alloeum]|uniref:phosphatidylinositol N-acetylglucosaminyltransferase subunit C n=1 Tax=Diachasma alloeum TaxID=454923 RepID=UPI0007382098|nr:phosphatidylinositol N-acetylglucosaminyltransferase subunit C [Diachasma alloeum]XP_015119943.1 phosphatidylinositol N-acetylglucosaminyltransferase subunit C [Diachasma alloeum]XP_015119944.1 phosphatidylinositol N-acetylglucosaminyltransferase subunit C [Diachasma alloeum]